MNIAIGGVFFEKKKREKNGRKKPKNQNKQENKRKAVTALP